MFFRNTACKYCASHVNPTLAENDLKMSVNKEGLGK